MLSFFSTGGEMTLFYRPVKPETKKIKRFLVSLIFIVLGRAFQSASRHDADIKTEVDSWDEGFTIIIRVHPSGPLMGLEKKDHKLFFRWGALTRGNLEIIFRNLESAFMVLTPQMGAAQAFAERRMSVKGDLGISMSFTRALNALLAVLYPRFIVKRLLKRVPVLNRKKIYLRIWLYPLGIVTGR